MALGYKARKRLSLLILLVGLPAYIVFVMSGMNWLVSLHKWVQLPVFVFLGVIWIVPLKWVFRGIGQEDPDNQN